MSVYPEWATCPGDRGIRQGDVLGAIDDAADDWRSLLVVITADCDLANEKHDGALTCVPVLRLAQYLLSFRFERVKENLLDRLGKAALVSLEKANGEDAPSMSQPNLASWLIDVGADQVISDLEDSMTVPTSAQATLRAAFDLSVVAPGSLSDAVDLIAHGKHALGDAKTLEKAKDSASGDFAGTLSSLPGDVMFLNEVSAAHGDGYVAYLRRPIELHHKQVATSHSQISFAASHVRLSRLASPYVYALTQKFAAVFADIGLPDDYSAARRRMAERIKTGEFA